MKVQPIITPHFSYDGRGPELIRWIHDRERVLPGTSKGYAPQPEHITGAEHAAGWLIFQGLQVFQTVPEEVHSYWFLEFLLDDTKHTGVYEVTNSVWKASFSQRHLTDKRHFIVIFYDELVEVLCTSLIFGSDAFQIHDHPELSWYRT